MVRFALSLVGGGGGGGGDLAEKASHMMASIPGTGLGTRSQNRIVKNQDHDNHDPINKIFEIN
jgi:hypothetical protein